MVKDSAALRGGPGTAISHSPATAERGAVTRYL